MTPITPLPFLTRAGLKRRVYAADQPEYQPLPVIVFESIDRPVTSCWQLTWRERLRVLLTGQFYLTQLTFGQPLQPQLPKVDTPAHLQIFS